MPGRFVFLNQVPCNAFWVDMFLKRNRRHPRSPRRVLFEYESYGVESGVQADKVLAVCEVNQGLPRPPGAPRMGTGS